MRIILWVNGARAVGCMEALSKGPYSISLAVLHPKEESTWSQKLEDLAKKFHWKTIAPDNPNSEAVEELLKQQKADFFVLAGYGKILKSNIINIPKLMTINLHGGKLPQYRGSSPMNWVLINGEKSFTLSIIRVDEGIDSGNILLERTFPISINDTIRELHTIANREFPGMLLETLSQIKEGSIDSKVQDPSRASYYPLRFPEDGLILWDRLKAEMIHNRIRALTTPYPGAFSFFNDKKVKLLASELNEFDYFGESGRIYQKTQRGLLICAVDKCLWIKEARFEEGGEPLQNHVKRYDKLVTLGGLLLRGIYSGESA